MTATNLPVVTQARLPRRRFLVSALSLVAATVSLPGMLSEPALAEVAAPERADVEIAALGNWLIEHKPEMAAELQAKARQTAQISPHANIDWNTASAAKLRLTQPALISAEIARDDVVFVDGWLLAHSEAGTAILFALALVQPAPSPNVGLTQ